MNSKTADLLVYPALAATTSAYALLLDDNKQHAPDDQKLEPDWTWATVVVGSLICLLAGTIRARLGPGDRQTCERSFWLSFLVGGTPIVLWQNWRAYARQRRRGDTLQQYVNQGNTHGENTTGATPRLAVLRRRGSSTNGSLGRGPWRPG
jgi:hypothetical protein